MCSSDLGGRGNSAGAVGGDVELLAGWSAPLLCFPFCLPFLDVSGNWSSCTADDLADDQLVRSSGCRCLSFLLKTLPSDRHLLIFGLPRSFRSCLASGGSLELAVDFAGLKTSRLAWLRRAGAGGTWKCCICDGLPMATPISMSPGSDRTAEARLLGEIGRASGRERV